MNRTLALHRLRGRFEWVGALTLLAFFSQALIPPGFMPASTGGGLQLCNGYDGDSPLASRHGGKSPSHAPCAFALAHGGGTGLPGPENAHFLAAVSTRPAGSIFVLPHLATREGPARMQSQRGPPAFP